MISGILFVLLTVFGCLGICDFIHIIRSAVLRPGVGTDKYFIVYLRPDAASDQLRYFSDKLRWYGSEFCDKLICIADDLSDVEASSCENFCYGGNIYLCRLENIKEQLNYLKTGESDG